MLTRCLLVSVHRAILTFMRCKVEEIFSNASKGVSITTKVIPFIYSYEILFLRVLVKSSTIAVEEVCILKVSINLFQAYK